jgi:hypothetical protein
MPRLDIKNERPSESGKTLIWDVFNSGVWLGVIRWYAPWRTYCFYPLPDRVFDQSCLREIATKLQFETKRWMDRNTMHETTSPAPAGEGSGA